MKILTLTTLYPNAAQPHHGVFVENRLRHLVESGRVESRVVAPAPWVPRAMAHMGRYRALARIPKREERHGLQIEHPRYVAIPKVGMTAAPFLLYAAVRPVLRRLLLSGYDFDLIDAHYFYPDGVAAAMLGRKLGKPVSITARGTDLNLIPNFALPRRMIKWAAAEADGLVTVCQALKDVLVELGVAAKSIKVLRNGVDLDLFCPRDRDAARKAMGLDEPALLSVGHLITRKAHDLVIAALPMLPDMRLIIVGEGPLENELRALARSLDVAGRVTFVGRIPHEALPEFYSAADALVLASSREGWPNVLLEAMACGTPVVASNVWGIPEIVAAPAAGVLMSERTAKGVAAGVQALFARYPDRAATRAYAEGFSWEKTTQGQIELFESILKGQDPSPIAKT